MSSIDVLMQESLQSLHAGQWREAGSSLHRVLQLEPGHGDALFFLGALSIKTGEFASALARLEQIAERMPAKAKTAPVLELKGFALLGLGQIPAAIVAFRDMFAASLAYQEERARAHVRQVDAADRSLYWKAPPSLFGERRDPAHVFTGIYERGVWGGGSGAGSNIERTAMYAGLVQYLVTSPAIRTVVDLGCGDWRFSRHLDLSQVDYTGIDVVASVITENQARYARPGIRFQEADVASFALPDCDLVLCKDVLQHLGNVNVMRVLSQRPRAKCWLITNDFHPVNEECENGDTRPLDPTAPPFSFPARPVLAFGGKVAFLADT
jgi:2-polyprenyl-3-methyl-5-hydroxy-6-metoxy-1,4-benzoquinol methylase